MPTLKHLIALRLPPQRSLNCKSWIHDILFGLYDILDTEPCFIFFSLSKILKTFKNTKIFYSLFASYHSHMLTKYFTRKTTKKTLYRYKTNNNTLQNSYKAG